MLARSASVRRLRLARQSTCATGAGVQPHCAAGLPPVRSDTRSSHRRIRGAAPAAYDYTPEVTDTDIVTLRSARARGVRRPRLGGAASRRAGAGDRRAAATGTTACAVTERGGARRRRGLEARACSSRRTRRPWSPPAGAARSAPPARSCSSGRLSGAGSTRHPGDPGERLHDIAEEMAVVEYRSSYSPDHPRDARLQLRPLRPPTAAWSRTPSRSPPQLGLMQFALAGRDREVGRRHRRRRRVHHEPPVHGRHPHARPAGVQTPPPSTAP